jgi:hypothetical protein
VPNANKGIVVPSFNLIGVFAIEYIELVIKLAELYKGARLSGGSPDQLSPTSCEPGWQIRAGVTVAMPAEGPKAMLRAGNGNN